MTTAPGTSPDADRIFDLNRTWILLMRLRYNIDYSLMEEYSIPLAVIRVVPLWGGIFKEFHCLCYQE